MSKDNPISWGERIKQSAKLAKQGGRNFSKDATIGQKVAATAIAGGTVIGGIKSGRKAWKRKNKKDRLSRTASKAARGAFNGAVGGAISGYSLGRAVDYISGQKRESLDDAIVQLLNDANINDVVNALTEKKTPFGGHGKMVRRLFDPRKRKGSIVIGATIGAIGSAASAKHAKENSKDPKKFSKLKHIVKGAAVGGVTGYAGDVYNKSSKLASSKLNRRWRHKSLLKSIAANR